MITAKLLKSVLYGRYPLCGVVKSNLRSSTCLTVTGSQSIPLPSTSSASCFLHTSPSYLYPGKEWRKKQGLPVDPYSYGPLTDGPDYSFLDGRPTPIGSGKLKRAREQQEIAAKIMKLNAEIDLSVVNHAARVQKEKEKRSNIIRNKLKPKGNIPSDSRF